MLSLQAGTSYHPIFTSSCLTTIHTLPKQPKQDLKFEVFKIVNIYVVISRLVHVATW